MQTEEHENRGTASVVAELVARLSAPSTPVALPNGDTAIFYGSDLMMHTIPNLNPDLPADVKASETFIEPASLSLYANMYKTPTAILKASLSASTVTALLDYHEPVFEAGGGVMGDTGKARPVPQRNQHHATYKAEHHPDFLTWRAKLGAQMAQTEFAEFIEDNLHTIGSPAAADLMEAIMDLKVHRAAAFENKVDLRGGKIGLTFKEEDSQGGRIQLPDTIVVVVPIYQGTEPVSLAMKLRYRFIDRALKLHVVCPGLNAIVRDEFQAIAEDIRDKTDLPLFYTA